METDKVKMYRVIVLFFVFISFSSIVFSQTCNTGPCTGACVFPPAVEKGCNCFDGKDNDGNGLIDSADPTCASYYGLTFTGNGSNCSITPPSANGGFANIAPPQTSAQNTADTPSKISVGDMNGDGVPDAVVTSKWNSTIQVVATATASGFSPGNIMGDFRTPGSKLFPKAGSNYVFEHETAIADIDKDGIGEMFTIASERGGSPNNPPTEYYLLGFKYGPGKGGLIPLFNAVDLGAVRPGSIGLADFDGDGKAEVYLRNQIYAAESGVKLADGGGNWLTAISSGPVAVNMLGDNKLELVCGNFIYSVPSLASRTLQALTVAKDLNALGIGPHYYPKGYNDVNQYGLDQVSTTSTADIDADGFMDVVITGAINCSGNEAVPCANNITTIFYWNVQKNTLSTYAPADPVYPVNGWIWGTGRVNLDDANGDGKMDLTFVAGAQIFCLTTDASGTNLVKLWVRAINDNPGVLSLTIYDFNNDGNPEVVYRDAQQLAVADGKTGQTTVWSASCQAYTFTEGPIVADVNGDGSTDICITCYTSNAFNLAHDTPQQESLGQTRLYYSTTNSWLPTRRVWNEHPYYVTNINDNLTLPFPQISPDLNFGNAPCPNGIPGPHRPFNVFMDQVPTLSASGCPIFPAPNLTYFGDTPNPACLTSPLPAGCDSNGDGVYDPVVLITPPICGNLGIKAQFNLTNNGNLPITDNVPVSFFNGDPTASPVTATRLFNTTLPIANLQVGATYTSPVFTFNGPGSAFTLYIAIYNDGSNVTLSPPQPITFTNAGLTNCTITDKLYSVPITPTPFTVTVEKLSDNNNCPPYNPPNTGQLRTHIFIGGVEVVDYSPYSFQWYTGSGTSSPIAGGTNYVLSNLDAGTYSVVVTNTQKGCSNPFVTGTVARVNGGFPTFTITKISDQTICSPPNGEVVVSADDGSTGYSYSWLDTNLNPIGVTSADAKNLVTGNYIVNISRGTCNYPGTRPQIFVAGPQVPDAQAKTLQNVVDCSNPNTGSIEADAYIGVTQQPPGNYTFNWYYYNNATSTQGSLLPGTYGTGPIRTGLPVGYYQAVITDNTTKCVAGQSPVTQVQSQTVIPDPPVIRQLTPQTSCDPTKPNGAMIADAYVGGVLQNPSGFKFQWFKGQNTLPANLVATVSGVNGQQVNQVAGGGIPYTVLVTTPLNCSSSANAPVVETINVPVVSLAQLTPNTVCDITKATTPYNGSIQATVTFAGNPVALPDPNYTFSWYDGTTTGTPHNPPTSASNVLSGLKDGNYAVTVARTDLSCTSAPQTTPVAKATVTPLLSATSTGSNNCDPALTPDGTVTVTVTNVNPGDVFTYQWYSGNSVVPANALGPANNGTSATAIKVGGPVGAPHPYTAYVLNTTTGCDNNTTQTVSDNSVIPVLGTSTTPNGICAPPSNFGGSMTVSVTNIPAGYTIADYSFTWYDGNTSATQHNPQPSPASTVTLPKLDAGAYSVIGKNTKTGCTSSLATNNVGNIKIFPSLQPASTGSNNCDPALTPDGTVSYTVTNVQPGDAFAQQWYIGSGDPIAGGLPKVATAPNNGTSITAIQLGGPTGAPKSYTVFVTNTTTGCTNFTTASVPDNSVVPVLGTSTAPNGICAPASSFAGSMTVSVTNIPSGYTIADYSFTWYDGNTNATPHNPQPSPASTVTLSTLDAGAYSVIGKNTKTGCTSSLATNNVGNIKIFPSLQPASTGSNNCDPALTPDGTVSYTVTNVQPGDAFGQQWYIGSGDPIAGGLPKVATAPNDGTSITAIQLGGPTGAPHPYTVFVTNTTTGCTNFTTASVPDNSVVPVLSTTAQPNDMCDPAKFDGSVTASINVIPAGYTIADYTFKWYDGNSNASPVDGSSTTSVLSKLDAGFYTVETTNTKTGCKSAAATNQVPNQKVNPVIQIATTGSHNCSAAITPDGTATATVTNAGADTFTFAWTAVVPALAINNATNNANQATAIKLGGPTNAPNSYNVVVTNNRTGCQNTDVGQVADLSAKPTLTLTPFNNDVCDKTLASSGQYDGHVDETGIVNNSGTYAGAITYAFTWKDVTNNVILLTNSPATSITQLNGGDYSATVTIVELGCTSDPQPAHVSNVPALPAIVTTTTANVNCVGPNGSTKVSAVDGLPMPNANYTLAWYNGSTVSGASISNAVILGTNLQGPSTSYTVQATNLTSGCQANVAVTVVDSKVTPTIAVSFIQNNTNCTGAHNGELMATVGSVGPAYTIAWSGGGTQSAPPGDHYLNLVGGTYSANVTDTNTGCVSANDSGVITDSPVYPAISVTVVDQTSCTGTPNGMLTASAAGPITYTWFDGTGTGGAVHAQTSANSGIINQLASANYTVQAVFTTTGCSATNTQNVPNNVVNPTLTFNGVNPVTVCGPNPSGLTPNGTATATLANITNVPSTNFEVFYVRTVVIGGVGAGTYPTDPAVIMASLETYSGGANPPAKTDLAPGYITALVVDNNTGCQSTPSTAQILDGTAAYTFQINGIAAAGLCGGAGGSIDITVNKNGVACGTCNFQWYSDTPSNTNINFFNNPPNMGGAPVITTDENLGVLNPVGGVSAGDYTVVVQDAANGCGAFAVENIPTSSPATIVVTPVEPTLCVNASNPTNNGSISISVTKAAGNTLGYEVNLYTGNAAVPANKINTSGVSLASPIILTTNSLDNGDYFVEVIDQTLANKNCPQTQQLTLLGKAFNPVVTINSISPNTSCIPGTSPDGSVSLTVTKDVADTSTPVYFVDSVTPAPTGFAAGKVGNGNSGQSTTIGSLQPQSLVPTYTISVSDHNSGCFKDVDVSVPDVQDVPSLLNIAPSPETQCAPLSIGSALASLSNAESTTHFNFTWALNNDLSSPVWVNNGNGATLGELINKTNGTAQAPFNLWNMGAAGSGSGDRIFFVQATRFAYAPGVTGVGCTTAIVQVDIQDQHLSPNMALSPIFNSFCTATAVNGVPGDGIINITADADPTTAGNQNSAGGFDFAWTNANGALSSPQHSTNIFAIPQLGTGSYQVTATNSTNGCTIVSTASINPAPYVINVVSSTVTDQRICNADGEIDLTNITVDESAAGTPNIVETNATPLTTNYDFKWYRANPATPGTFNSAPGQELADTPGPTPINNQSLIAGGAVGQYATMGAGTYYVVATRKASAAVAAGCPAQPYRVDVKDVHQNPSPQLTTLSNTSCLPPAPGSGEGEIFVNITDATNPFFKPVGGFTFSYVWSGGAPATLPANGPGNGNGVNGDFPGDVDHFTQLQDNATPYSVAITNNQSGCSVNAAATIIKNATPVFVQSVTVVDQVLCAADGSLTVAQVSLNDRTGANQTFTSVSAPNISDFNFNWTRSASVFTQTTAGTVLNTGTYNTAGFGVPLGADTYTVVAKRTNGAPGAGCSSAPFTVTIKNKQVFPVVSLTPLANTSCNPAFFEGEIKVFVTDASVNLPAPLPGAPFTFNYTWPTTVTAIGPTNNNNGDGYGGGELNGSGVVDNDGDHPRNLQEGTYSISVTNPQTGCVSTASTTIFKNGTPVFTQLVTATPQVLCTADGKLQVNEVQLIDRNGVVHSNLSAPPNNLSLSDFDFDWQDVNHNLIKTTLGANGAVSGGTILDNNPVTGYAAIGAGTYFVVTRRVSGSPGQDCASAPYKVDILNKQVLPVVSLTPLANTSCNPAFFEGEIKVFVTDASVNLPAPLPGAPFTFNYTWPTTVTAIAPSNNNNGDGYGGGELNGSGVVDNDGDHPKALQEGTYSISVTNPQTGCVSTASTTLFKNGTPVFTQLVTPTPQVLCTPDGKLQVNEVQLIDRNGVVHSNLSAPPNNLSLSDFDFDWQDVNGTLLKTTLGANGAVSGGTILDNNPVTGYAAIGAGTYYVVTRRVNGSPGQDCASAPYKVDILNKQVLPVVALTPLSNTSCDPAFFEGEIKVVVTDASVNLPPPLAGAPFLYNYTWTSVVTAIAPSLNNDGDGYGGGELNASGVVDNDGDHPKALQEGNYTISVTNTQTGCSSPASTTIFKNGTPVFTQQVTSLPQVLCTPDGSLQVKEIRIIDRNGVTQSNLNTPPDFALTDFVYTYDRVISGTTTNVLTNSANPFLDNTNYNTPAIPPGVGFGTYYVTTTRRNGFPGKDCSSAPYEVVVDDQRLFPKVAFTSIANSSCNVAKPNGSITAAASEQNGTNTGPYTFIWTLNGQPVASVLPTPPTQTDASPNSVLTNALDGAYITTVTNTITGCPFNASFNLELDQTRSTPNIIDVTTVDPLDCNPSASATVTKITLGSTFNSTSQPPNIPPNNAITGPALAGFVYTWASGAPGNVIVGQTSPTLNGVKAGSYFVSVKDPNTDCQSGPKEADISNINIIYPVVNIAQTAKQISCLANTGTAALAASAAEQNGTTGTYQFTWYPSLDTTGVAFTAPSAPSTTNNPNSLLNLFVGNYSVKVQNTVSSCKAMALFIVPDDAPTFMPVISGTADPLTFCVGFDGDAEVRVLPDPNYPNPPSYNYKADLYYGGSPNLSNPPDVPNLPSIPGPIPGVNLVFEETGLNIGLYTFKVTDNNTGCITSTTVEVKDDRKNPVVVIVEDQPLTNCDPAIANGQLSATADNGKIEGYLFNWYTGTSVVNPASPLQTDNKLIGEGAGSYTVRVTSNLTQCFTDQTGSIKDSTLLPPIPTAIVVADRTNCITPNGEVSATVGGVTINYAFDWYNGAATKPTSDYQSPDYQNLDIGPYTVTATDDVTGCVSPPATVTVADKRVLPVFDLSSTPSYCIDTGRPKGNGSVTLTLNSPGMFLQDIQWTDNSTNAPVGLGPQIFELFPGTYDVKAVSTEGCETDGSVALGTEIAPYNGISANGDGQNDAFIIDCITNFPHNNVKIFNRSGIKVYEADGYDNGMVSFRGIGMDGVYLASKELPVGTYFYIIDKRDGTKPKTGYLELNR